MSKKEMLMGAAVLIVLSAGITVLGVIAYRMARSPSEESAAVIDQQAPPADDEAAPDETGGVNAGPVTVTNGDSLAALPPPAKLVVDYTGGGVAVREDGSLELRAKNAPFNFGEPATASGAALADGDKMVVFPAPRALSTDSTGCKASQVEYRLLPNGTVEVVTRGCTRITRWE